jgi:hypothetical protein
MEARNEIKQKEKALRHACVIPPNTSAKLTGQQMCVCVGEYILVSTWVYKRGKKISTLEGGWKACMCRVVP